MFANRLAKVYKHLRRQADRQQLTCWRVYDHDLPEFPLCIEFYGDQLQVAEYRRRHGMTDQEHDDWLEKTLDNIQAVLGVPRPAIHVKLRQRKPGRQGQYQRVSREHREMEVTEAGLRFLVNLRDYLDTGLFLDHRITRQMVREESYGKRVINLFAYTGSFSVYAAAGGASRVTTVDMSRTYLDWARRNMALNGFADDQAYAYVQENVLTYLRTLHPGEADLMVLDPPTFSNSRRMEGFLDIQRDHVGLIRDCLAALSPGGVLYFSTNFKGFRLDQAAIAAAEIRDITRMTTPFDFQGKLQRFCCRICK